MNEVINNWLTAFKSIINANVAIDPEYIKKIDAYSFIKEHSVFIKGADDKEIRIMAEALDEYLNGPPTPKVISRHQPGWVKDAKANNKYDSKFWDRYSSFLISNDANFPVPSLNTSTEKILDYVHNPKSDGKWNRKGMVVGHVQSGKTSNYIGLMNKAIGHGYKLIIVLTGMYDDLRIQTQQRIDYGIIGELSASTKELAKGAKVGVGRITEYIPKTPVMSLTSINPSSDGDFTVRNAPTVSRASSERPTYILAIKKNRAPLSEVIKWLDSLSESTVDGDEEKILVKDLPTLIIDDEADSASVNTGKEEEDPKTINRLIRVILNMLEKVCYVGYTATPYANVFIEASDNEKFILHKNKKYDISLDLFPSDFIINLQAPKNYFGPHKVFSKEYSHILVKQLEDFKDSYRNIFPITIKTETQRPTYLPESLKDAILQYILTATIREIRDGIPKHNSMLVHVSLRILWIDRVAKLVNSYLEEIKRKIIAKDNEFYESLNKKYISLSSSSDKLSEVFNVDMDSFIPFAELWSKLLGTVERIQVISVHGGGGKYHLEHEITDFEFGEIPRYFICVGGNRLSRGITLEGLTISYFIRVSKMYDSLMQMGRWFGYRNNYADLCRLYTSKELSSWYSFITEATEELRDEFNHLNHNTTPRNYSLKVRKSPDLLKITSLGKMRYTKKISTSFDGTSPTLRQFTLDKLIHSENLDKVISKLSKLPNFVSNDSYKSLLWDNQRNSTIVDILLSFSVFDKDRHNLIIEFIEKNKDLYDNNWRVLLFNNSIRKGYSYTDVYVEDKRISIYGVQRKGDSGEKNSFKIGNDSLTSGDDRVLDYRILGDKEITRAEGATKRAKENIPLLLLYLIDGYKSLGDNRGPGQGGAFESELAEKGVLIPAYFIVFPGDIKNKVKKVMYVSNLIGELDYQISDDED